MVVSPQYGLRFAEFILKVIVYLLTPLYLIVEWLNPHKQVPPITDKLLLISATELAEEIRNGKIKSEQVVQTYIKRIREVNPIINAVVEDNFKVALEEARAVDEFIAKNGRHSEQLAKDKPLLGVPMTIKESCSVKGLSCTGGVVLRKGIKAKNDGNAVALLRQAGAIILAVTNTSELCMSGETYNRVFGRTSNPYNTNRTCAGSSGGEGALIASAASIVGIGSDLAGSIRVPAMFNGIFGHKSSSYVTPFGGHFPESTNKIYCDLAAMGPLARYAQDLKLIMKVLAKDKASLLNLDKNVNVKNLNIFYKHRADHSLASTQVDREIRTAIYNVADYLDKLGANVTPANFLDLECNQEMGGTYMDILKSVPKSFLLEIDSSMKSKNLFLETVKALAGYSHFTFETLSALLLLELNFLIPPSKMSIYENEAKRLGDVVEEILGTNGVLLYPTFPTAAFRHRQSTFFSNGLFYAMMVNIWGFPATHVPLGLNKQGLPIGLQVIAGPNQDRLCLAIAEELEKKFGGWVPPTTVLTN